jgi:HAD superfamily hydrolase (TIGR01509 family)
VAKAVVSDLWETLATWPQADLSPVFAAVGMTPEQWAEPERVARRWTGSFEEYFAWAGVDSAAAARGVEIRPGITRRALVPVDGAVETLAELRSRGLCLGLISNCSGDECDLWEESPFGGLFDAAALSAAVGICKPDARIYRLALDRLGVRPEETLFVGDGHSGELGGAEAAGMRAVQIESYHPWDGERIAAIPDVLALA